MQPLMSPAMWARRAFAAGGGRGRAYDVAVIGGGPGGYVAAIKCAQLGLKTVCVERRPTLGGTCLNVGCIPSKALLHATHAFQESRSPELAKMGFSVPAAASGEAAVNMAQLQKHKDGIVQGLTAGIRGLFKANGVDLVNGTATFRDPSTVTVDGGEEIAAKHFIIATGSESTPLPEKICPGGCDEEVVLSSTGALGLREVPERLAVIGGGVIGLELGSVYRHLGSRVSVIEFLDRILPTVDRETAAVLGKSLQKDGIEFSLSTKVTQIERGTGEVRLCVEREGRHEVVAADKVLVAVGRRPYVHALGLENIGVQVEAGRVPVDPHTLSLLDPANKHIFAIGDVIHGAMLAHKAEEEGVAVAERIARGSGAGHVNYAAIPSVVYTSPELAGVGQSEEELVAGGRALVSAKKAAECAEEKGYVKAVFPFAANSRARASGGGEGFVKVLADARSNRLLGAWVVGPAAGELIAPFCVALSYGASAEDVARTCLPHPSLSEALKEACMGAAPGTSGWVHMPPPRG